MSVKTFEFAVSGVKKVKHDFKGLNNWETKISPSKHILQTSNFVGIFEAKN